MKRIKKFTSLIIAMAMTLSLMACGADTSSKDASLTGSVFPPEDVIQQVYDALTSSDSDYSAHKEEWKDYVTYTEALDGDTITISAEGEYNNGSWDFALDGDYITSQFEASDYYGLFAFQYICDAVRVYLGMDEDLFDGYLACVGYEKLSTDYITVENNDDIITVGVYVTEAYDFSELDTLYMDADVLKDTDSLDDNNINNIQRFGKIIMYSLGSRDSADIYIGEMGSLSDLAYKSLVETIKALQPDGYEDFLNDYTGLSEAETEAYTVTFPTSSDEIPEAFSEIASKYQFVKVHFGIVYDNSEEYEYENEYEYEDEYEYDGEYDDYLEYEENYDYEDEQTLPEQEVIE